MGTRNAQEGEMRASGLKPGDIGKGSAQAGSIHAVNLRVIMLELEQIALTNNLGASHRKVMELEGGIQRGAQDSGSPLLTRVVKAGGVKDRNQISEDRGQGREQADQEPTEGGEMRALRQQLQEGAMIAHLADRVHATEVRELQEELKAAKLALEEELREQSEELEESIRMNVTYGQMLIARDAELEELEQQVHSHQAQHAQQLAQQAQQLAQQAQQLAQHHDAQQAQQQAQQAEQVPEAQQAPQAPQAPRAQPAQPAQSAQPAQPAQQAQPAQGQEPTFKQKRRAAAQEDMERAQETTARRWRAEEEARDSRRQAQEAKEWQEDRTKIAQVVVAFLALSLVILIVPLPSGAGWQDRERQVLLAAIYLPAIFLGVQSWLQSKGWIHNRW